MGEDEPENHGDVIGRSFKEKLLLAIIDAYPTSGSDQLSPARARKHRADRLRDAMGALFGIEISAGRPTDAVQDALWWMAYSHRQDRAMTTVFELGYPPDGAKSEREVRSIRKLADEAAQRYKLPAGSAERLRKKYSSRKSSLMHAQAYHDDVPEQLDYGLLQAIAQLLQQAGIRADLRRIDS